MKNSVYSRFPVVIAGLVAFGGILSVSTLALHLPQTSQATKSSAAGKDMDNCDDPEHCPETIKAKKMAAERTAREAAAAKNKHAKAEQKPEANKTLTLRLKGLHCEGCEMIVKEELLRVPGVKSAQVSHVTQTALVGYTRAMPKEAALKAAVVKAGYKVVGVDIPGAKANTKK